MDVSAIGILSALVLVGVTVEAVEAKSKKAAYVLVLVLLLGIVTFNAAAFRTQSSLLIAALNRRSVRKTSPRGPQGATNQKRM